MEQLQIEMIAALRELTLQLLLIAAGVFGIVGGFVASADKTFVAKCLLILSLLCFAASALAGYLLHGAIISLLNAGRFDPFHSVVQGAGLCQIGFFLVGGILFICFIARNVASPGD